MPVSIIIIIDESGEHSIICITMIIFEFITSIIIDSEPVMATSVRQGLRLGRSDSWSAMLTHEWSPPTKARSSQCELQWVVET